MGILDDGAEVIGSLIAQGIRPRASVLLPTVLERVAPLDVRPYRRIELARPPHLDRKPRRLLPERAREIERHRRMRVAIPSNLALDEPADHRDIRAYASVNLDISEKRNHRHRERCGVDDD